MERSLSSKRNKLKKKNEKKNDQPNSSDGNSEGSAYIMNELEQRVRDHFGEEYHTMLGFLRQQGVRDVEMLQIVVSNLSESCMQMRLL